MMRQHAERRNQNKKAVPNTSELLYINEIKRLIP